MKLEVSLLVTFYVLNFRLDKLLITHLRSNTLNFRCINKTRIFLTVFVNGVLPSIVNRPVALFVSHGDETPRQYYHLFKMSWCLAEIIHQLP